MILSFKEIYNDNKNAAIWNANKNVPTAEWNSMKWENNLTSKLVTAYNQSILQRHFQFCSKILAPNKILFYLFHNIFKVLEQILLNHKVLYEHAK